MIFKMAALSALRLLGWTFKNDLPEKITQCVLVAAPHTSNWDALYTKLGLAVMQIPAKLTIKDSYMRMPFGPFVRAMGGIGIDRSAKQEGEKRPSMVESMAALFKTHPELIMLVTPEGTRDLRTQWKTGFYHVAVLAKVPIVLAYVDYRKKLVGVGKIIHPTGNIHKDMKEIMDFYKDIHGKYPEKFSIDINYQDET